MVNKSKEVQGLLFKVAELEVVVTLLTGLLTAKGVLTSEDVQAIYGMAEVPEIIGARIQRIEAEGAALIEARKRLLSEMLGVVPEEEGDYVFKEKKRPAFPHTHISEEDVVDELEEESKPSKGPDKKLH